jgi:3-oxoacyl-[acyl-carrier protein] reductase
MIKNSSDKPVVLITGASAGIGEAIAHRFAKGGFNIVAVARRKERLAQLVNDLKGQAEVAICAVDITAADSAQQAIDVAMKTFGRLDCLVNNAGSFEFAPVGDTSDKMLDDVIDVSLKAPFRFCRSALAVMKPGSSIITIGSVWGILAGMGGGSYCAVKAALIGMTQSLARPLPQFFICA